MKKKITIDIDVYESTEQLNPQYTNLLQEAKKICDTAYAPYSKFHVGAAILLENGEVIRGSNQENAALPSSLCAERTAIYWVGANYPNVIIKAIAIVAYNVNIDKLIPISPCGACRQAMAEYENNQKIPIKLIMKGNENEIYVINSVDDLLPLKFSNLSLKSE